MAKREPSGAFSHFFVRRATGVRDMFERIKVGANLWA